MKQTTQKPPMPYAGGKQGMADWIVSLFPDHDHYCEPFAGALSVLLAKPQSRIETVNDINGDLVNFWRVLREQPDELARVCALTPHSREEYYNARCLDDIDDVERARRVWVQLTQGRGARVGVVTGWRFVHGTNRTPLSRYLTGYLARIAPSAQRLRDVSIENRDALDVIRTYQRPDCLLYVDPPYLRSTRHGAQYAHELGTEDEHRELLELLLASTSPVALSGYDSPLYADLLAGWTRHRRAAVAMTGEARTEVLWTNYEPHPTLWSAT